MNKRLLIPVTFLLLFILLLSSCREDVIAPGNPAGNINEPVRIKEKFSYSFYINAYNISTSVSDVSGISSTHSTVSVSLDDYTQGTASFNIYDNSNNLVYRKVFAENGIQISESLEGSTPDLVWINFNHFTGKLQIKVFVN